MPTQTKSDHSKKSGRFFAASCRRRACAPDCGITGVMPYSAVAGYKSLLWAYFLMSWNFLML